MRLFWDFSVLHVWIILFLFKNIVNFFFSVIFECEPRNDSAEDTLNYRNSVLDLYKHVVGNRGIHSTVPIFNNLDGWWRWH